jgi:hypothetical protein
VQTARLEPSSAERSIDAGGVRGSLDDRWDAALPGWRPTWRRRARMWRNFSGRTDQGLPSIRGRPGGRLTPPMTNSLETIPNGSHRSTRTESSNNDVESAAYELVVADDDTLLTRRAAQAITRHRDQSSAPRALRLSRRSRREHSDGDENRWYEEERCVRPEEDADERHTNRSSEQTVSSG